jgi:hypothetical protein
LAVFLFAKKVHEAKELFIQADVMKEHMESASRPEYTTENIAVLLHQVCVFFLVLLMKIIKIQFFSINSRISINALHIQYSHTKTTCICAKFRVESQLKKKIETYFESILKKKKLLE